MIGFLGFSWCFGGDLLWWVAVVALGGAGFVFQWCCGGVGWAWVSVSMVFRCGGAVVVCNGNTQQL